MNKRRLIPSILGSLLLAAMLPPAVAATHEPYPLDYFALRPLMQNVNISPDGKHVAMLKIVSKTGNPILHIYEADDMDRDPFVVNSDPMEIVSYYWASDDHIVFTARLRVRKMVKRQEDTVYEYRIAILDVANRKFEDFDAAWPRVENLLAGVPHKIIVSEQPGVEDDLSTERAFRPRTYYEMDLKKNTKKLLIRGKWDLGQIEFDGDGNPRLGRGYDAAKHEYVYYYRDPGEKRWRDVYRHSEDTFDLWFEEVVGFDDAVPGNLLVKAFNGDDKLGLWSFNPDTGSFDELIYRRSDVDVTGVRMNSNRWQYPDRVAAVSYFTDKPHYEYFDEIEDATYKQLEELIPNAHWVNISSRSRDGSSLIATNQGPRDPGSYYLLHNGEFKFIGSRKPMLEGENLSDLKYIKYKARDGRDLRAYVTIPKGEAPYPTVVMPHGGPHVHERVMYDEWAQMLANNGYMVVQPQYRMSMGYGKDHFLSAFINGSEAGRKMQDDKDDAALYLVERGLADPDRLAMYGWSYGGYAALIASSRTPQIYQCVIAGAAVSNYRIIANDFQRRKPRGISKIWRDVYEYGAVHPTEEVPKVNVPILLIHGNVDARVLPKQAKIYLEELEEHGKTHEYLELDGASHFGNELFYDHKIELYTSIIDFLENDCGTMSTMQAKN